MLSKTTALALSASLASCAAVPTEMSTARTFKNLSDIKEGIWKSDGYGYILDLSDGQTVYNITRSACLPISGKQENPMQYFDSYRLSDDGSEISFSDKNEPFEINFERLDALPSECTSKSDNTPLGIFDTFSEFFQSHYAFFDLYDVDWPDETSKARVKLSETSGEGELVETFIGLVSKLKDGHVSISATVDGDEGQFMANPGQTMVAIRQTESDGKSPMAAFGQQYLEVDIDQKILGGGWSRHSQ